MTTPSLQAGSNYGGTGSGGLVATTTVVVPSGAVVGDYICIIAVSEGATATFSITSPTFTQVAHTTGSSLDLTAFYRKMDGTEGWTPGTTTITVTSSATTLMNAFCCAVTNTAGYDIAGSIVSAASTTITVSGVTTTVANDLVIGCWGDLVASAGGTPAVITKNANFTVVGAQENTSNASNFNTGMICGTWVDTGSGATGAQNGTCASSEANCGLLIAFKPSIGNNGTGPYYIGANSEAAGVSVNLAVTPTVNTTAGDIITVACLCISSTSATGVVDSVGNVYINTCISQTINADTIYIFESFNSKAITTGGTITATQAASDGFIVYITGDNLIGGRQRTSPVGSAVASTGTSASVTTSPFRGVFSIYNCIAFWLSASSAIPTVSSPFTELGTGETRGTTFTGTAGYDVSTTPGATLTPTATVTSDPWVVAYVVHYLERPPVITPGSGPIAVPQANGNQSLLRASLW